MAARKTPKKNRASALLKEYERKRDFSRTAEPSGREATSSSSESFVVQKHEASHLHYDFRLEMDGVLKSWAVAKGPSVDPAIKRLAIEVEDHPLAYGEFEGTIPKGEYGGGTVMLWDRGTWTPVEDPHKGLKSGRMKFRLNGEKMKGLWALVRMKPRPKDRHTNWLLIKDRDAEAVDGNPDKLLKKDRSVKTERTMAQIAKGKSVWHSNRTDKKPPVEKTAAKKLTKNRKSSTPLPSFIEPQLATRVDAPPEGDDWLHEIKFDGYRLHIHVENGAARILTRHGHDWTAKFADLAAAFEELPVDSAYIDGEAVILDSAGLSDFGALQAWFKKPSGRSPVFYAFDLLFLNGQDLREQPLTARKALLQESLKGAANSIRYSDHQMGHGDAFFKSAAALHVEGIISKVSDAAYMSGRSRGWLKIKRVGRQEFVIGGYTLSTKSDTAIGALLLGEYKNGKLIYVGKVGTGYTAASAKSLFTKLSKSAVKKPPFESVPGDVKRTSHWTRPQMVAEIEFGAWTSDHILRHAAFLGLRDDKTPRDVKTEDPIAVEKIEKPTKTTRRKKRLANDEDDTVAGVTISHPERLIYRPQKITKLDLARYYEAVGEVMLPHIANRPLSLVRCPDGVGPACFFQKHTGGVLPDTVNETRIGSGKGDNVITIDSVEGLIALVQYGVLEFHTWGTHLADPERPDLIVFDFDPDPTLKWTKVVKAAVDMRDMLKAMGLTSFAKTTGGKGLHVVVPIKPALEWDAIKQFTKLTAGAFAATNSDLYLINMSKKLRAGHIFVDYLRNGRSATAVAPYSARAREGAQVATPLSWAELEGGAKPGDFTLETVVERVTKRFKDPWAKINTTQQQITKKMIKAVTEA